MSAIPVFRQAIAADLPVLREMYNAIIEEMDKCRWHAQWRKDGYPTDDFLSTAAAKGEMWLAEVGGEIAGAVVLNHACNPGYEQVEWLVRCPPEKVVGIHTLGISPAFQRRGMASAIVRFSIELARAQGMQSVRLDVIDNNLPADKLYTQLGFSFRGRVTLNYEGDVCTEFNLYEYPLSES